LLLWMGSCMEQEAWRLYRFGVVWFVMESMVIRGVVKSVQ